VIAWWGWVIIWVGLSLALVAMLVVSVVSLFRKGVGVLSAFGELASSTVVFDGVTRDEPAIRNPAVLLSRSAADQGWRDRVDRRAARSAEKRQRRLDRARALVRALDPAEAPTFADAKLRSPRGTALGSKGDQHGHLQ
jgi:hypothetical protein